MNYTTVYEIPQNYFPYYGVIPLVLLFLFSFLLFKSIKLKIKNKIIFMLAFCVFFTGFLCVANVYNWFYTRNNIIKPYFQGQYLTANGYVEHFEPLPVHGNGTESFEVNGVRFTYSKSSISYIGYNIESSNGGFIKANGQSVKIRYIYDDVMDTNLILRLDVNESDKLLVANQVR